MGWKKKQFNRTANEEEKLKSEEVKCSPLTYLKVVFL